MSDFDFSIDDLTSDSPDPFSKAIVKDLPDNKPLKTSASVSAQKTNDLDSPAQLSTLSVGEIMMGTALFDDPNNALAKQETLMTSLLGSAVNKEPQNKEVGPFSGMIPTDIAGQATQQAQAQAPPDPSGTNQPAVGQGQPTPGSSADGKTLVANPNIQFQSTAGGNLAKQDIIDGKIAPNVVFALSVLASQLGITISCGASDLSGHRNQGHAAGSLHYQFKAVDIVDIKDLASGRSIHIANSQNDPLIRKALDILNTITGPRRPDQVISLLNTGYPGFISAADHWNHIHLGTHVWGEASAPTQVAMGTTATPAATTNHAGKLN